MPCKKVGEGASEVCACNPTIDLSTASLVHSIGSECFILESAIIPQFGTMVYYHMSKLNTGSLASTRDHNLMQLPTDPLVRILCYSGKCSALGGTLLAVINTMPYWYNIWSSKLRVQYFHSLAYLGTYLSLSASLPFLLLIPLITSASVDSICLPGCVSLTYMTAGKSRKGQCSAEYSD